MQEHYNFTDAQYASLVDSGVTIADLFKAVALFDPNKSGEPLSTVSLLYYVDSKGDFNAPPKLPHKKIALAFFDSLPIKDKICVAEYIEVAENNWQEVDDED